MPYRYIPHFIIKDNAQKTPHYFSNTLTEEILSDICYATVGEREFTYEFVDNPYNDEFIPKGYNKGRLALLFYLEDVYFISLSEQGNEGRNSSIQSVPTAYNLFYSNGYEHRKLCYYFMGGELKTEYHRFIYRLMKTVGFDFINDVSVLGSRIEPFTSIYDLVNARTLVRTRNRVNNSTYVTVSEHENIEIYAKTYGANKYESSLICYAISILADINQHITIFQLIEGDLKELPQSAKDVIEQMGVATLERSDMALERRLLEEEEGQRYRSPRFTANMLQKYGPKKCAFCGCEIQEIIEGAHIWPVSSIRHSDSMGADEKLQHALSADNGLWICVNHHRLFDDNIILLNDNGGISFRDDLDERYTAYLRSTISVEALSNDILNDEMRNYICRRNNETVE